MAGATTIATIGVYGWTLERFLAALGTADVRLVLDVRQRRGVRGAEYAWANSLRLQDALSQAGIGYRHRQELAPTSDLRQLQYHADARQGVGKRSRAGLAPEYRERYLGEILDRVDLDRLLHELPPDGLAALMCVERDPEACHRSLIAERLAADHDVSVVHLRPSKPPQRVGLEREHTVDLEVTMKGASKPKKLGKKVAQKSLKEKRQDKRAAAKKGFGST
jgi:uncharacterized protein (DUF488 family)